MSENGNAQRRVQRRGRPTSTRQQSTHARAMHAKPNCGELSAEVALLTWRSAAIIAFERRALHAQDSSWESTTGLPWPVADAPRALKRPASAPPQHAACNNNSKGRKPADTSTYQLGKLSLVTTHGYQSLVFIQHIPLLKRDNTYTTTTVRGLTCHGIWRPKRSAAGGRKERTRRGRRRRRARARRARWRRKRLASTPRRAGPRVKGEGEGEGAAGRAPFS